MTTIYVDNKPYKVSGEQNLLAACLSLGFNIPYFCWHPAMHSVGACRQCAVKLFRDENDTKGKIVMSCMTHALDGMRISIDDPDVRRFRARVIELLMTNHPHDCPICDEGGECHLQDMTVMTGHNYRRFRFKKRTHRSQYLGPFVSHHMNRCIACYRCVRFYCDYAGGRDLNVFRWHNQVYFGRDSDGVLDSEFSGNLVEVCPTGVFTDKTLERHYTRKWDLQTAPSVCVHCSLGCNTIAGERYGTLRRILNRYHSAVNGYFLCDRGRFGYEFVNSTLRIRQPMVRSSEGLARTATTPAALDEAVGMMKRATGVIGIGSPRASLEANFALQRLVGPERFFAGVPDEHAELVAGAIKLLADSPTQTPSLAELALADAVVILGEDLLHTAPMMALSVRQAGLTKELELARSLHIAYWHDAAVRQAIQRERGPIFIATPSATGLDGVASRVLRAAPDDIARLAFAVAHILDPASPDVGELPAPMLELAGEIAGVLKAARRPVIITGTGCSCRHVLDSAAVLARAANGRLSVVFPEANSMGLGLMGGAGLDSALAALLEKRADTVVVLENDLYRRCDGPMVDALFDAAKQVIVLDHLKNATTDRAGLVLPAATFAEADGTLVNNEGRAQRFYSVFVPDGQVAESWRWLRDIMAALGRSEGREWKNFDDVVRALADEVPVFTNLEDVAPSAQFRLKGRKIARESLRYSGRTAETSNLNVNEPKPPDDPDSPLAHSMEGAQEGQPASLIPRYWAPGWNSVQATTFYQDTVGGPLHGGDPGVLLVSPQAEAAREPLKCKPPKPFVARAGEWLLVPMRHIFGDEELSAHAPGVAELAPAPYLALNPDDAEALAVVAGQKVRVSTDGAALELPAKIIPSLPRGVGGLPAGQLLRQDFILPAWVKVEKVSSDG